MQLEAEIRPPSPSPQDLEDKSFDPFAGHFLAHGDTLDPFPLLHQMARESWVHPVGYREVFGMKTSNLAGFDHPRFTVFGYDRCAQHIPNTEVFSNRPLKMHLGLSFGATISGMEAPEHTRYRRIFQKAFLPQYVRRWGESVVDPVVTSLLAKVVDLGHCDLIKDFTLHYPFHVVYRQLNLPPDDTAIFHKLAVAQTTYWYAPEMAIDAGRKLGDYFLNMIRQRREDPGQDLVSVLCTAEADGEQLPEEVVLGFLRQLMNAGGDTTYRATSCLLAGLLQNPDQLEAVRRDRSLVASAIEEGLRWNAPVMNAMRMTNREITIDGFTFPKDAWIDFCQGEANREASKFANPDSFDISRDRTWRHLSFTTGPHVCIGQHLARVEMERALNAILDRLPGVRLDPDMPPPEIRGFNLRTPDHLYVRFD
ncbi:MAG: cytochrome P450 [Caulobacteraceae bacterium]|nr:cytochrome P450 [Caulobacteraceae bacterium]